MTIYTKKNEYLKIKLQEAIDQFAPISTENIMNEAIKNIEIDSRKKRNPTKNLCYPFLLYHLTFSNNLCIIKIENESHKNVCYHV